MKTRLRNRAFARIAPMHFLGGRAASGFFVILASTLLLVSIVRPAAMDGLRIGTSDLFAPLLQAASQPFYDVMQLTSEITGLAELQSENASLRAENAKLREWYQTAMVLKEQNQTLQSLLNVKAQPQNKFVTTRVIADGGNAYVKTVLVAAGMQDGVHKDQAVLAKDGMIGRVIEAGQGSARVLLLTDINSRIPVLVEGLQDRAILTGTNEAMPILRHLPPGSKVKDGMRVVTSGHGGVFPPSLPVGEVVLGEEGQAHILPYADMNKVLYVRIVDAPADPHLRRGELKK